jgi:hypothetical protein
VGAQLFSYRPIGLLGIEPSLHAPEACVLPVYYSPFCELGDFSKENRIRIAQLSGNFYNDVNAGCPRNCHEGSPPHRMGVLTLWNQIACADIQKEP